MTIATILVTVLLVMLFAFKNRDRKFIRTLDRRKHPLIVFYPFASVVYGLAVKLGKAKLFGDTDKLARLNVNRSREEVEKENAYKVISLVVAILLATYVFSLACVSARETALTDGTYVRRPESGEGKTQYSLTIDSELLEEPESVTVNVTERRLEGEDLERLWDYAFTCLEEEVLGNNGSFDRVTENLNFITSIPDTSVSVTWEDLDYIYFFPDGTLRTDNITSPVIIDLTACLEYFDERRCDVIHIKLVPKERSASELFLLSLEDELLNADGMDEKGEYLKLPSSVGGFAASWSEKKDTTPATVAALGLICAIAIIPGMNAETSKRMKKREEEMMRDYPDIVSKFTMLLSAGMTVRGAWEKLCRDYREKGISRYAYDEMSLAARELELGISETKVYENFGNRVGLDTYRKFGTILARNVRRGSREIISMLETEADDAFAQRREAVKKKGEEVGTKLLIPMMGMLCIVMAIVLVPAFKSFGV